MPTVLRSRPFRFFFYAVDSGSPPHIHVERDDSECKFWLDPIRLERNHGVGRGEIKRIRALVDQHKKELLESWHEFFNG
jgi:hypothetical protein